VTGVEQVRIPPLAEIKRMNEMLASANVDYRCRVLGIAMNSRRLSAADAENERQRVRAEFGLPVCDVIRHGPDELIDAVLAYQQSDDWRAASRW
jgi:uncharacterized NAD-dependent epimerase/dehydratase family protein